MEHTAVLAAEDIKGCPCPAKNWPAAECLPRAGPTEQDATGDHRTSRIPLTPEACTGPFGEASVSRDLWLARLALAAAQLGTLFPMRMSLRERLLSRGRIVE